MKTMKVTGNHCAGGIIRSLLLRQETVMRLSIMRSWMTSALILFYPLLLKEFSPLVLLNSAKWSLILTS